MKKNIYVIGFFLLLAAWTVWKLRDNKKVIDTQANLSLVSVQYVPVQVTKPTSGGLGNDLTAAGVFFPRKEMWVISETAGRVLQVYKDRGDSVKEGEVLAKIDDELLRLELETTQIALEKLQKDRQRLNNLIDGDAVAKSSIEEVNLGIAGTEAKIKGISRRIADTEIKSPLSGIMTFRVVDKGGVIGPGIQVAQITDISSLRLMVRVPEREVIRLKKGMVAEVSPEVYPGLTLRGTITTIGIQADNTFTYDVEIAVPNPSATPIKAGMNAKARFRLSEPSVGRLNVPRQAILGSLQDAAVYVLTPDSTVQKRSIMLGNAEGDRVEVLSGLKTDDQVVLTGQINLTEGAKVKVIQ